MACEILASRGRDRHLRAPADHLRAFGRYPAAARAITISIQTAVAVMPYERPSKPGTDVKGSGTEYAE